MDDNKLKELADIISKVADGADWEWYNGTEWNTCKASTTKPRDIFWADYHYKIRIKSKTININGFEVPEPVRTPLNDGDEYWFVEPAEEELVNWYSWSGDDTDFRLLELGFIHTSKENAILHSTALLSFTKQKKES